MKNQIFDLPARIADEEKEHGTLFSQQKRTFARKFDKGQGLYHVELTSSHWSRKVKQHWTGTGLEKCLEIPGNACIGSYLDAL